MAVHPELLQIDGSIGEGGGQVLRTCLTMSMLTGRAFRIRNIRAGRSKPGLLAQHLKAVDAAVAISNAHVEGAYLGATCLLFEPHEIRSGRYKFDIGTAGSVSLLFQTVFLPLSRASAGSSLIITGGTHVPWSPSFHFLQQQYLNLLNKIGFDAQIKLVQAGYYPQGRGRLDAHIRPCKEIVPLKLLERGELVRISGICAVSNLRKDIAERQKRQIVGRLSKLNWITLKDPLQIKVLELDSSVKGTFSFLHAQFENGCFGYTSLGELGKPAEQVADEAVEAFISFYQSSASIDQYLADQLLLPLCLAEGNSEYSTSQVTQHLMTNAEVIRLFLPVKILISGDLGASGVVYIYPDSSHVKDNPSP